MDSRTSLGSTRPRQQSILGWATAPTQQLLHAEAVAIAKKFTGSAAKKYQAAAEEVRIPYWDWASDDTQSRIPQAVSTVSLTVTKPGSKGTGTSTTIPNPLYQYRFTNPQPSNSGLGTITVRGGDADSVLFSTFPGRKDATLRLFSDNDYNQFSRDAEGIHNAIHVDVGGNMVSVPIAAFDPIFWLHHCNVDRLMAMYQASHPGLSITPAPRSPTFALGGDGPDDLFTPLYPFRHTSGKEWTSNDLISAESIFTTGYAYPEVPAGKTGDALRIFATQKANQLYGPNLKSASFVGNESGAQAPGARREWTANVLVNREELPGSHRVLIYIGKYDKTNPDSYGGEDNLVGVAGLFAGTAMQSSNNQYLNISIPLTEALVAKNIALRPEDVVPTLADQLHWTVEKADPSTTNPIPITDLKTLKIAVSSTITEYFEDKTKLAVVSDPLTHYEPTKGKTGGLQPGESPPVGSVAPPVAGNGTVATR
ncbi:MAG: hypothetical protein M1830_000528 [Pleopsidium flavum]|nr:MAG: hypothetical protein M1830_000528 [Pleopsidium flavum]